MKPRGNSNLTYDEIKDKLIEAQEDLILAGTKVMAKDFDADKTLRFLLANSYMDLVHGYLVCYAIDLPWYATKPVLTELLVLRVRNGGKFQDVTDHLEAQAKRHQCPYVAAGTTLAASDELLARAYQGKGYSPGAIQMVKEIDLCASA